MQLPLICVLTVTVASGVTVPSAGSWTAMSPVDRGGDRDRRGTSHAAALPTVLRLSTDVDDPNNYRDEHKRGK